MQQMTREMVGWDRMWACIKARYGSTTCECPDTGEVFQYMGTHNGVHEFRHRSLPANDGRRTYATVEVMPGDDMPVAQFRALVEAT